MRYLARTLAIMVCASLAATAAFGQEYPSKPVTLVVPFAAGSGTDGVARIVASKLGDRLKQPIVIENKAGANAQIAAQYVAKAAPDGYTLLMATNTSHSANPGLVATLRYDPIKDFTPVARLGELPFALLVNANDPANNLQEWLEQVRRKPGTYSYATPNSTSLVASETIKRIARLDITGIPYRASPQALADLMGGQVQMYVADLGSSIGMIKAGRVKILGVTTRQSLDAVPGAPSIARHIPGFDLTSWNGIFGPAGVPRDIVQRLNAELQVVLGDPEVKVRLQQIGFEVWPSRTPEEFTLYVADQLSHWSVLIKQAGIPPQ